MGSKYYYSSETGCKFLFFVFGCVVIAACVCFVAVVPLRNSLESVLRGTVNACVCKSLQWCEMACVFVCVWDGRWSHEQNSTVGLAQVLAEEANPKHPEACWQMWTDAWCRACSWHKPSYVLTQRYCPHWPMHPKTSSSSTRTSSSKVRSRHSLNTQGTIAQQQPAPALYIRHK